MMVECWLSGGTLSGAGGPGLYDPCEKEPTDVLVSLTNQMREDLTASAQVKEPSYAALLHTVAFLQRFHKYLMFVALLVCSFSNGVFVLLTSSFPNEFKLCRIVIYMDMHIMLLKSLEWFMGDN